MYLDTEKHTLANEMRAHYQSGSGPNESGSEEPPHKSHLDRSIRNSVPSLYIFVSWVARLPLFLLRWIIFYFSDLSRKCKSFWEAFSCQNNYSLTTF
jgi:hypothetical protein